MRAERRSADRLVAMTPQQVIIISAVPPVLFLDTPEHRAVAEHVTQRSVYTLRRYERRGLKIHTIPGRSESGDRHFIRTEEYLKFLEIISD